MNDRVAIVGVGWSGFHPLTPEYSYKELMYEAALRAYTDAGVDPRCDIDSFVTVAEDFHEGTSIFDEYVPDQIGAVLSSVHTIPGDGLHGLATAYMMIRTGNFDIVAVEAHSKASNLISLDQVTAYAQDPVINRPLEFNSDFVAGLEMNRYLFETNTSREQCASVVVKNRRNAILNPRAAYPADMRIEDVLAGPQLSWPLGRREKANHTDGAIVMILSSGDAANSLTDKPVWINGMGWTNGSASLESRDWALAPYLKQASRMAYRQADINNPLDVIDFAELDDTYAYKELQALETLGFCGLGAAGSLTKEGYTLPEGQLPVNVSGGSLGVGHLMDATGMARALEVVLQLRGEAGSHQLNDVEVGLVQSWRGVPTTSGAVAVLSN